MKGSEKVIQRLKSRCSIMQRSEGKKFSWVGRKCLDHSIYMQVSRMGIEGGNAKREQHPLIAIVAEGNAEEGTLNEAFKI